MRLIIGLVILVLPCLLCCKSTELKDRSSSQWIDETVNLYAFIGKKISVIEFDPNKSNTKIAIDSISGDTIRKVRHVMDSGFICRYKVLKNVFNRLETDTIEFKAYDHYGRPGFENYTNVLLYLSKSSDDSEFFHQKYQYDVVYNSKNGSWNGENGESIADLFRAKRNGVFRERKVFNE